VTVDLPDRLDLPLTSGAPWWYWLGDRPALDLVNTLRERWRRRVECLPGPEDLVAWLRAAGLLEGEATATPRQVEEARALREAIDAAVGALIEGGPVPEEAVAVLDGWLGRAAPRPALALRDDGPALVDRGPADPVEAALGLVALDAARMIGPNERGRVRVCASDTCSARFYDRSPAGRRRWCSMSECGNRAKARRHRARRATTEEEGGER
jgi:predicted RNA-binding Zn ribbon-like protein